ncbi:MAG: ABC transporter substrate-binding protein [Lautropia sp.]
MRSPSRRRFVSGIATGAAVIHASPVRSQPDELAVGTLCPLSGPSASYGASMQQAITAVVERINQRGGVAGKRIRLFHENSETDPNVAVIGARKLIGVNRVAAILGMFASAETLAVSPICIESGVLLFTSAAARQISDQNHRGLIFQTEGSTVLWGPAYGDLGAKYGKTAAIATIQAPFAIDYSNDFKTTFEKAGGKIVEGPIVYAPNLNSYRGEVARIVKARPEVVFLAGYLQDSVAIMREAIRSGLKTRWLVLGYVLRDPQFVASLGAEFAEGAITTGPTLDKSAKGWGPYIDLVGKPERDHHYSAQTYDQMTLLALGLEAAKGATGVALAQAVRAVSSGPGTRVYSLDQGLEALRGGSAINYDGASSPVDFNERGMLMTVTAAAREMKNGSLEVLETYRRSL